MSNKVNPNIVKLTSLSVTNKKIEFIYKIRNNNEFELRFEEKIPLHLIHKFIRFEDLGKLEINVAQDKVTIVFNEDLTNILYLLKEENNIIWGR